MKTPLDNASPLRLTLKEGRWTLEFEALEQKSNVVFKPIVYTVDGVEAILASLERMGEDQLAEEAQQLIEQTSGHPEAELSVEPREGAWVPSTSEQVSFSRKNPTLSPKPPPNRLDLRREALKQSLAKMRSLSRDSDKVSQLEKRIAELEAQIRRLVQGGGFVRAPDPAPYDEEAPPPDAGFDAAGFDAPGFDAPAVDSPARPSDPLPVVQPEELEEAGAPGEADEQEGAEGGAPEEAEEAPTARLVSMPKPSAFQATVRMLVGTELKITQTPKGELLDLTDEGLVCWVSKLVDDNGQAIGFMLSDLVATVNLGGGLLMMPQGVLEEQIESAEPEQDVLESMSEVFNTASSLINELKGNAHIRVLPVEQYSPSEFPWVGSPSIRLDVTEEGGGRVVLAGR